MAASPVRQGCNCPEPHAPVETEVLAWVGRLVHAHRASLGAVARREGLSAEDAFDVVQESFAAFVALPAARRLVDAREDARRLLVTVTRNLARNRRRLAAVARRHDTRPELLEALPASARTVDEVLAAAETEHRLRGCVASLGQMQRAVVTLRMLDEVDGDDAGRALGVTPGHVAVLLHRAKANLRACMTDDGRMTEGADERTEQKEHP